MQNAYLPPEAIEAAKKIISGKTLLTIFILFVGFSFFVNTAFWYLALACLVGLVAYIAVVSTRITSKAFPKGANAMQELNMAGDAAIFEQETRKGTSLELFSRWRLAVIALATISCLPFFSIIVALNIGPQAGVHPKNPFSMIWALLPAMGFYMFITLNDKRLLAECRRRNKFVGIAEKRHRISKILFALFVIIGAALGYHIALLNVLP